MNQKIKKVLQNSALFLVTLIIALIGAEYLFRWMLFGKHESFKSLKDPTLYTNAYTQDYWKLYYGFGGTFRPLANPHPLLGWVTRFDRNTYMHIDSAKVGDKRPVLIYGDSFIQCLDSTIECFHDLLNNDTSFNKNNFLLNYGGGGYGIDQIFITCSLTVNKYPHPLIIFSIMPTDMDRCILAWRTGQKPYFIVENDQLVLKGIPIEHSSQKYYDEHPATIHSYMWARFLYSTFNQKYKIVDTDKDIAETKEKIKAISEKIILSTNDLLKSTGDDYIFMLYDELWDADGDWRQKYLIDLFIRNHIPFINTTELVQRDTAGGKPYDFDKYIIHNNGHPTSYYNKLVVEELKKYVDDPKNYSQQQLLLNASLYDANNPAYYEKKIRESTTWLDTVTQKAKRRAIPLDGLIRLDALYMVEENKKKK